MLAAVTISGAIGATAQAEEVVVKKGDTLWGISRNYQDVTVDDIKTWNQLSTDLIHPNDKLTILIEKHYIVQPGDTLWDIALANGTSVDDLKGWNNLGSDLIRPGLNLVIHPNSNGQPAQTATANTTTEAPAQESANNNVIEAPAPAQAPAANTTTTEAAAPAEAAGKTITVTATAYTANCAGCSGITSTGIDLRANPDAKVISVDPNVIPLGSKVYVEGYGNAIAGDTGGAIKGNIIDIFIPTQEAAVQWGRKQVKVTILD